MTKETNKIDVTDAKITEALKKPIPNKLLNVLKEFVMEMQNIQKEATK